jgi:hypothetical protein
MHYETARRIVRAPILTWKGFFLLAFCVPALLGVQSCAVKIHRKNVLEEKNATITAKGVQCTVNSVGKDGKMQLRCPAKGVTVLTSSSLALDYTLKPRPLTCTLYQGNEPICKLADRS